MPDTGQPQQPQQPSIGDKVIAGTTYAAQNAAIIAAPIVPGNTLGVGGIEVTIIAHGINGLIQALKMHGWYKQNTWAAWTAITVGFLICILLWHDEMQKAILNGLGVIANVIQNYRPLNTIGVLPPGLDAPPATEVATT